MSEFFDVPRPPPVEPEPEFETPPWLGPPRGTLPGVVALELILAQTDQVAVCITRLEGYATGFGFDLVTMAAPGSRADLNPMLLGPVRHHLRAGSTTDLSAELLRIGVQFADGSRATNVGRFHQGDDPPEQPMMNEGGGGGGGGDWRQSEWVWPLPPPGPLGFVCQWPEAGIELTSKEIDAQLILDAAGRARAIFPNARSGDSIGTSVPHVHPGRGATSNDA